MNEGSVMVDTGSVPFNAPEESSQDETIEVRDDAETQNSGEQGAESQETETSTTEEPGEGEGQKLTEKGTKLDPNPQSAVHQELANAKRLVQQYESVLKDPEVLKEYAKQQGLTIAEAKAEVKEAKAELKKFTPDRFNSAQDVADALNELQTTLTERVSTLEEENQRLRQGQDGLTQSRKQERIVSTMESDASKVREKYPALDPKSPEYNPAFEKAVATLYAKVDIDPATGLAKGNFSILDIADQIMEVAGLGTQQGSQRAQTQVKVKQAGRVVTSSKAAPTGASKSHDPSTSIAQKIAAARKAAGK